MEMSFITCWSRSRLMSALCELGPQVLLPPPPLPHLTRSFLVFSDLLLGTDNYGFLVGVIPPWLDTYDSLPAHSWYLPQSPAVVTTLYTPCLRFLWDREFPNSFLDISYLMFAFAPGEIFIWGSPLLQRISLQMPPLLPLYLNQENCYPQAMQRPITRTQLPEPCYRFIKPSRLW